MFHLRHGICVAVISMGVAGLGLSAKTAPPAIAAGRSTARAGGSQSAARQRERQERAWRRWYDSYRRALRRGYSYPTGYPPGYTGESNPTTAPSGGANNGVVGVSPNGGNNGALFHNPAVDHPAAANDAPAAVSPTDPDVLAAVARVKKACLARSDYQTAVADKKTAEDRLAALRPDGLDIDPAAAMPLAKTALDASLRMAAIELEETAKDAQSAGLPPQTQPAEAAAK
ncbi:MAG TPA: hypothetical protein VG326_09440 [Tepidisphaeraceae bacterium]|jgi:hypothetical protein|nr:hypothetical protein [Tepidisphaeraceae bacterium]